MRKVKILLINPPFHRLFGEKKQWYPLGIYYIRGFLNSFDEIEAYAYNLDNSDILDGEKLLSYKERYYNSVYYDVDKENILWDEVKNKIIELSPDIVGIYSFSEGFASAIKVSKITKGINPDIVTILGGPHVDCISEQDKNYFCYLIEGEGEIKLLNIIAEKFSNIRNDLKNKLYKQYKSLLNDSFISDIDTLPFPFSEKDKDIINNNTKLPLLCIRGGCPLSCSYCTCSIAKPTPFRIRSIDKIIEELINNYNLFKVTKYFIVDDTFTYNREYIEKFCNKVKQLKFRISWSCTTHVKYIDAELLNLMKNAGCHSIHIGIETGSSQIMKLINKSTTIEEIKEKASLIKKADIKLKTFYMVGFPEETKKDIEETKKLIKELAADEAMLHIYIPYPKTRLYRRIEEKYSDFNSIDWKTFKRLELQAHKYMGEGMKQDDVLKKEISDFFSFIEEYEK